MLLNLIMMLSSFLSIKVIIFINIWSVSQSFSWGTIQKAYCAEIHSLNTTNDNLLSHNSHCVHFSRAKDNSSFPQPVICRAQNTIRTFSASNGCSWFKNILSVKNEHDLLPSMCWQGWLRRGPTTGLWGMPGRYCTSSVCVFQFTSNHDCPTFLFLVQMLYSPSIHKVLHRCWSLYEVEITL